MAALSDGERRSHMDTRKTVGHCSRFDTHPPFQGTKILNGAFIVGGVLVALFTSWLVYTLVQSHIRKLQGVPPEVDELAAEAIEEFDEEDPLLQSNSQEDH
ncbi:hypothetical protein D9758_001141 [Tetrapyrgos nigripes]|uniref:Transmembrane protein n=1 Tax=Tetrapyrgos nigripes TaxID=182062 RepID=A0A8H5LUI2_9AGAR|nr:hypothetical protein D9758_001141 [Tetrapyrgos nigripes]